MSLQCKKQAGTIYISGDTYPHRDAFKSIGGRFCWDTKSWMFEDTFKQWDKVRRLCAELDQAAAEFKEDAATAKRRGQEMIASVTVSATELAAQSTYHETSSQQLNQLALDYPSAPGTSSQHHPAEAQNSASSILNSAAPLPTAHQSGDAEASTTYHPLAPRVIHSDHAVKIFSIRELSSMVEQQITTTFPQPLWLIGEIQDFSVSKGGHRYFKLAESVPTKRSRSSGASAALSACLWRDRYYSLQQRFSAELLAELLRDDIKIKMYTRVTYFQKRGQISLEVLDLDPEYTAGEMAEARQKLLKELERQGLRHRQKSLFLPLFPLRIGLITAAGSRAYSDFIHQLNEHPCGLEITFVPAAMQGESCPPDVCAALQQLETAKVDIIVLTRGGGSMADLQWFNDRDIAYSIANLKVPVMAAIGHHDDECVAQDVAHKALKTPTATAEYIHAMLQHISARIEEQARRSVALLEARYDSEFLKFQAMQQSFKLHLSTGVYHWEMKLHEAYQCLVQGYSEYAHRHTIRLQALTAQLQRCGEHSFLHITHNLDAFTHQFFDRAARCLHEHQHQLAQLDKQFHQVNPLPWLEAGWAMVFKQSSRVRSIAALDVGETVDLRLQGGSVQALIQGLKPAKHPSPSQPTTQSSAAAATSAPS